MGKKLVLIGGGHAHMMVLADIGALVAEGYEVSVVQPSEYHYYSGMGAGMLGGTYSPDEIRFKTRQVVEGQGGRFIKDYAVQIDPDNQRVILQDTEPLGYDVLSCNAGSQVPRDFQAVGDATVIPVKPIAGLEDAGKRIRTHLRSSEMTVAVVGGGPSAIEIAGNLRQLSAEKGLAPLRIQLFAGSLSRLPDKVRRLAEKLLRASDVEMITGSYVESLGEGEIRLRNQKVYRADLIFSALGVKPSSIFAESGLPIGPDGGLHVNEYLQSTAYDNIFGGGDCIFFAPRPLDKVGVYAVRQNPVLLNNLWARLDDRPLTTFDPGGPYLLIYNLGRGRGIFAKWSIAFSGFLAFRIKDMIDRKFMRTFQALEKE